MPKPWSFARERLAPLAAALATLGYAVGILGFGLTFRPLHNDEGVTLGVASRPSARDVLDVAVNHRHGPPLDYLLVHASLAVRDDILGLRVPSALFGIAAVALAYALGRELLGSPGGAVCALVTATSPLLVHLGQFARGYTALIAASYASLWLLLVLLRTRRPVLLLPFAFAVLVLVSAHPFGLFALATELVIAAGVGLVPLLRRRDRTSLFLLAGAIALGAVALVALHAVYEPLRAKYGVGSGPPVVDLGSTGFWHTIAADAVGSPRALAVAVIALAVGAGLVALALHARRAAFVALAWLAIPLGALGMLTASSHDFAPERHLSFLLPGYAVALAGFALGLWRLLPGRLALLAPLAVAAVLAPALVADVRDLQGFSSDLRRASLALGEQFGPHDVLLTSGGTAEEAADPRLFGDYAVLAAGAGEPLARWRQLGPKSGCPLVALIARQRSTPQTAWALMRVPEPVPVARALRATGATVQGFGRFLLVRSRLARTSVQSSIRAGVRIWRTAARAAPELPDLRRVARVYRAARALDCGA